MSDDNNICLQANWFKKKEGMQGMQRSTLALSFPTKNCAFQVRCVQVPHFPQSANAFGNSREGKQSSARTCCRFNSRIHCVKIVRFQNYVCGRAFTKVWMPLCHSVVFLHCCLCQQTSQFFRYFLHFLLPFPLQSPSCLSCRDVEVLVVLTLP